MNYEPDSLTIEKLPDGTMRSSVSKPHISTWDRLRQAFGYAKDILQAGVEKAGVTLEE